jgi:hypothetical protein
VSSRRRRFWRLDLVAVALGLLLCLPSLLGGFLLDDHVYLAALEDRLLSRDPSTPLFRFFDGDPARTADLARQGWLPGWIDDGLKIAFFRPLSDLLIRADFALFGRRPLGYHVHSLAWWLLTLLAARLVLRRALPGAAWAVALLLLALDESHTAPAGWISNRNALVAIVPALSAIWAHLRWREEGWRPGRFLAPVALGVGLLGSEMALGGLAYLVSYELVGRRGTTGGDRFDGLWPCALLVALYLMAYRVLGYGTAGSGIYLNPLDEPWRFLAAAAWRLPTLLSGAILGFSADLWLIAPALRPTLVGLGLSGALLLLVLLRNVWRDLEPEIRRGVTWLLLGAGLSMLPVVAVFPSDRLMVMPSVGLLGAVAVLLVAAWRSFRSRRVTLRTVAGAVLAIIHLGFAPVWLLGSQDSMVTQARVTLDLARATEVNADDHVILVAAPDYVVGMYLPLIFDLVDRPTPRGWRLLSLAPHDHRLTVSGPRRLELRVLGGSMLERMYERLYRNEELPLASGSILDRGMLRAEVLEATASGPVRVAFHFDRDLADPSLRFLHWQEGSLQPLTLPGPGQTLDLPRELGPAGF